MFDFIAHLTRQAAFSRATFGPGPRTKGVIEHITKEFREVEKATSAAERAEEWTDIAILGLDGLLRACREKLEKGMPAGPVSNDMVAAEAMMQIVGKQQKNELRDWPDWRTMSADGAIEHVRSTPPVTAKVHRATDLHPRPEEN